MSKRFNPSVVTANHLLSGEAVWLDAGNRWSPDPRSAVLLDDADTAAERLAWAQSQGHEVVGVYLAEARQGDEGPEPVHFREAFRMRGPSNHAHGKQAELCRD